MKILHDAFDLACLRIKPLSEYQYPLWQVWAVLAGVALAGSTSAVILHTDQMNRALFIFSMKALQYLAMARFFKVWLQLKLGADKKPVSNWNGQGSLLTLLILVQAIDFVQPLLLWLDDGVQALVGLFLFSYSITILVLALARSTETSIMKVLGGLLLCAPMLALIGFMFAQLGLGWGWIHLSDFGIVMPPPEQIPTVNPAVGL